MNSNHSYFTKGAAPKGRDFSRRRIGLWVLALFLVTAISACPAETTSTYSSAQPPEAQFQPGGVVSPSDAPLPSPEERFGVRVWTDSAIYQPGDNIRIFFRSNQDAYVYIFNTDASGMTRQLFPNYYDTNNHVRAAFIYQIPDPNYSLQVMGPVGRERLDAVAISRPLPRLPQSFERFEAEDPFPARGDGVIQILEEARAENERLRAAQESSGAGAPKTPKAEGEQADDIDARSAESPPVENAPVSSSDAPFPDARGTPLQTMALTATDYTTFEVLPEAEQPETAPVEISSTPTYAAVYVNNAYMGYSPLTLRLPFGASKIRVHKAGYYDAVRTLNITEPRRLSYHFNLVSDSSYEQTYRYYRSEPYYTAPSPSYYPYRYHYYYYYYNYPYSYYDGYRYYYYRDGYRYYYYNPYRYRDHYRDSYRGHDRYRDRDWDRSRDWDRDWDGRRGSGRDDDSDAGSRYRRLPDPEPPQRLEKRPLENRYVVPTPQATPNRLEKREVPMTTPPSRFRTMPAPTPERSVPPRSYRAPEIRPAPTPPPSQLRKTPAITPAPPRSFRAPEIRPAPTPPPSQLRKTPVITPAPPRSFRAPDTRPSPAPPPSRLERREIPSRFETPSLSPTPRRFENRGTPLRPSETPRSSGGDSNSGSRLEKREVR